MIHTSAQPCAPEDCPLGPFVHEEEELEALTPSKFPVICTQPGSLMVLRKGLVGGMAVLEDTVDPPVAQVLLWDVAGSTRASLTRLSWSNWGLWWPTVSARRSTGALANNYEHAVWWC